MNRVKPDIRTLSIKQIGTFLEEKGEKAFRAKQIDEWLWKKSARNFADMTNLSTALRALLEENFSFKTASINNSQVSNDRTIKAAVKLFDGNFVESVLIPTKSRVTACISSQVGCSLTCAFCATGKMDRKRNLTVGEIYDQVVLIKNLAKEQYNQQLTNIVYMGMGEPLLNYKNVIESVEKITSDKGLGMSPSRITISTAGIAKIMKKCGDDNVKFNLALSLHAANDKKRNKIMPINESNSLVELGEAIKYYHEKTGNRMFYEYIIFKDFNDTLMDAQELAEFCKISPCKINIIEYNSIDDGEFQQADIKKVDAFADYLTSKNLIVNVRRSRGKDIDAACGQLANKS